jgi:hypothetical protein
MVTPFPLHVSVSDAAKLNVNEGDQLVQAFLLSRPPADQ